MPFKRFKKSILIFSLLVLTKLLISCNEKTENKLNTNTNSQEDILKTAIKQYPDSILLKENLVQYYRDSGNYTTAIKTVETFLKTDTNSYKWWHIKGVLEIENTDTIHSIQSFQKAISIEPNVNDWMYLGNIYAHQKNMNAIKIADLLINKYPKETIDEAYFIKGIYFSTNKSYKEAISYFEKCEAENYTFMECYIEKSRCLISINKIQDAITVLKKAITIQNSYYESYLLLGKCYLINNEKELAIDAFQKVLLYNPDDEEASAELKKLIN
jgi:tetratricopeptide (TPR) repeat protein